MITRPTRAAIYRRVSTRHQEDGFSLADQRQRLVEFAESQGWSWTDYCDPGRSGESLEGRPELLRLLSEIDRHDVVLVVDDSRLARDSYVSAVIHKTLIEAGVRLATPAGVRDLDDPQQLFTAKVLGAASELEQGLRTAKMRAGIRRTVEAGYWPGGPPPYGYQLVPENGHKRLAINEDEAAVLRMTVDLILDDGHSTYSACRELTELGIRTRHGSVWDYTNLCYRLRQPYPTGIWTYDKDGDPIEMDIPVLIPASRWHQLQAAIRGTRRPQRKNRLYPLSGRGRNHLHCGCGGDLTGMVRVEKKNRAYYRCNRTYSTWGDQQCRQLPRTYRAVELEQKVWALVEAVLSNPDYLIELATTFLREREPAVKKQQERRDRLQARLDQLGVEETRIVRQLAIDDRLSALSVALADVEAEEMEVRAALDQLQTAHSLPDTTKLDERIRKLVADAREGLADPSNEMMAEMFDLLDVQLHRVAADRFEGMASIPLPSGDEGEGEVSEKGPRGPSLPPR